MDERSHATFRERIVRVAGALLKALPPFRGRVRAGMSLYRLLHRPGDVWQVETALFPERLRFRLNLQSAHERMAWLMNGYEPTTTDLFASLHRDGSILDVGANIGLIALPLARRTRDARLFAFEPVPSNFVALTRHIEWNRLDHRITPFPFALGDRDGMTEIAVEVPGQSGTANILPAYPDANHFEIELRTIDSLISDGTVPGRIDLVKLDTDGYDLHVLRGATKMLREHRPIIYAELNDHCLHWHGERVEDAEALLRQYEYELLPRIGGPDERRFRRTPPLRPFDADALLVPAEQMSRVEHLISRS